MSAKNFRLFRTMKIGNVWYIAWRGQGFSESGFKIERNGWKVKVTKLSATT